MPRILFFLQTAFSLWMLVDAIRRRSEYYWWIIIMVPFGEWFYFFQVKIHDPEFRWIKNVLSAPFRKKVTVKELRYRLRETPCFANKLKLAQALHDEDVFDESEELFEKVLEMNEESAEARYGLASSRIGLGQFDKVEPDLRHVIENNPSYDNYSVWSRLAEAVWAQGRETDALGVAEELVSISPRMSHRLLLAQYCERCGRYDQAKSQIATALEDYEHAPPFQKRNDRGWARLAKKMAKELGQGK
ncbi:MAG: hypothetical protein GY906_02155 [bacterium]|nr:hypothetical protein [bacterium]